MSKYMVDSSDLTSVADTIRSKAGTDAPLEFPDEFVSAVAGISGSPFELYRTSARYVTGDTLSAEDEAEIKTMIGKVIVCHVESGAENYYASFVQVRFGTTYFFSNYGATDTVAIAFETEMFRIYSIAAIKDGVTLPSPTIWFDFYKLKES